MPDFDWKHGPFVFTSSRAYCTEPPDLEQLEDPITYLAWVQRHIYWWIGDMLLTGERFFGDDYFQVVDPSFSPDLLQRCIAVAAKFPPNQRNPNLSWSHHLAVIKLDPRIRVIALKKAEREGWGSKDLHKYVQQNWLKREMLDQLEMSQEEDSAGSQD